jgi:cobalt-zinc-cadmium efflux system outer membrane protein
MPTRNQVCAWVAGFGLVVPTMVLAQDRTEREVVDLIVREGPQARIVNAGVEVVRREQVARVAYPNPTVGYTREGAGFTEFLQVEQSLPIFGVRGALDRAGAAATAAADAERTARLWALRADASALVGRLAASDALVRVADEYVGQVERLIEILRTREREGEGSRFDRLRAEHELHEARLAAATAGIDASDKRVLLAAMLPDRFQLGRIAWAPLARPVPSVDVMTAQAFASRADLRALDRSIARADLEASAASRSRMPGPTLVGGLKRSDGVSGRESGGVFGVSFAVPLFDSGGREGARWTAERERLAADRAALDHQIRLEIVRSSAALTRRQALAATSTEASNDLMDIAEVAYREGEIGILELLDAARTTARTRSRSVELQLDVRLAEIALERAVGESLWP